MSYHTTQNPNRINRYLNEQYLTAAGEYSTLPEQYVENFALPLSHDTPRKVTLPGRDDTKQYVTRLYITLCVTIQHMTSECPTYSTGQRGGIHDGMGSNLQRC